MQIQRHRAQPVRAASDLRANCRGHGAHGRPALGAHGLGGKERAARPWAGLQSSRLWVDEAGGPILWAVRADRKDEAADEVDVTRVDGQEVGD